MCPPPATMTIITRINPNPGGTGAPSHLTFAKSVPQPSACPLRKQKHPEKRRQFPETIFPWLVKHKEVLAPACPQTTGNSSAKANTHWMKYWWPQRCSQIPALSPYTHCLPNSHTSCLEQVPSSMLAIVSDAGVRDKMMVLGTGPWQVLCGHESSPQGTQMRVAFIL